MIEVIHDSYIRRNIWRKVWHQVHNRVNNLTINKTWTILRNFLRQTYRQVTINAEREVSLHINNKIWDRQARTDME